MAAYSRSGRFAAISGAAILAIITPAFGHGRIPNAVPIDRLLLNLEKFVQEHPDNPDAYYRLGRAHTLALETKTGFVLAFARGENLEPAEGSWTKSDNLKDKHPEKASPQQLREHLTQAIENLNEAIAMKPTEGAYRLTLACVLEAGKALMNEVDVWPLAPVSYALAGGELYAADQIKGLEAAVKAAANAETLDDLIGQLRGNPWESRQRDVIMTLAFKYRDAAELKEPLRKLRAADWELQIEEQFFTAMTLALPANGKATEKPIWGGMEDWVAYEAGKDFLRVVEARKARDSDAVRVKVAKATIKAFDQLPRPSAITPIILDLSGRGLDRLKSSRDVRFDLDGTGLPRKWSWVSPDAGILVWDPEGSGRIVSGRQLLGSVSWWLFFENGYQALDALDSDRDAQLTKHELEGLAVWFDRDSDGVSDVGEVVLAAQLGIDSIACRATAAEGHSPTNPTGLRTSDGRVRATMDWIAQSSR